MCVLMCISVNQSIGHKIIIFWFFFSSCTILLIHLNCLVNVIRRVHASLSQCCGCLDVSIKSSFRSPQSITASRRYSMSTENACFWYIRLQYYLLLILVCVHLWFWIEALAYCVINKFINSTQNINSFHLT